MGNLHRIGKSSVITDTLNTSPIFGVFGEQVAMDIKNDVLVQFQYGLSSHSVSTTVANGGTVTTSNSMVVVSSSAATNGEASVQSVNALRYRPGHTATCAFTAMFPGGGVSGATQYAGAFDDEDGIFLGFNETGRVVGYRNGGIDVLADEADWNGDARAKENDWSCLNVFRITFGWLGTAPIVFQTLIPGTSEWATVHAFQLQGTLDKPHIGNPATPVRFEVKKTSGDTDVVIKSGSWQAGVMGLCAQCGSRPFAHDSSKTLSGTAEQAIAHYRSKTALNGKTNKVRAQLLRYQFFVDNPDAGDGTVIFRIRRVASIGGTPSWQSIDADNSAIEFDQAGTYVATGAILGLTEFQNYDAAIGNAAHIGGGTTVNADPLGLFIDAGGIYAITAEDTGGNGVTVRWTFNWSELF